MEIQPEAPEFLFDLVPAQISAAFFDETAHFIDQEIPAVRPCPAHRVAIELARVSLLHRSQVHIELSVNVPGMVSE